jgi:hypothetical protein
LSGLLHRMAIWRGAIALVALVGLAAVVGQTRIGHDALRKSGLLESPTSYTSLAFVEPQDLIENLASNPQLVSFPFVIHNASSASQSYEWSLLLVRKGHSRVVAAGEVRVTSGGGATITRSTEISCAGGQVQVIVKIASPVESIHAWMACVAPSRTRARRHVRKTRHVH